MRAARKCARRAPPGGDARLGRPRHGPRLERGGSGVLLQCWTSFSAPIPVNARTSSSADLSSSGRSLDSFVPSQPRKNESGMDTRPGLFNGNQWKSTFWNSEGLLPVASTTGAPETTGEKMISPTQVISPPYIDHSAPWVVNFLQNSV